VSKEIAEVYKHCIDTNYTGTQLDTDVADFRWLKLKTRRRDRRRVFLSTYLLTYLLHTNDYLALVLPRARALRGAAAVSRPSVRLSVCNVEVLWAYRLDYFDTNVSNCTNN